MSTFGKQLKVSPDLREILQEIIWPRPVVEDNFINIPRASETMSVTTNHPQDNGRSRHRRQVLTVRMSLWGEKNPCSSHAKFCSLNLSEWECYGWCWSQLQNSTGVKRSQEPTFTTDWLIRNLRPSKEKPPVRFQGKWLVQDWNLALTLNCHSILFWLELRRSFGRIPKSARVPLIVPLYCGYSSSSLCGSQGSLLWVFRDILSGAESKEVQSAWSRTVSQLREIRKGCLDGLCLLISMMPVLSLR